MTGAEQEQWRRATEARAWLRDGYTSRRKVDELMVLIVSKRGQAAADVLREDMREQWRHRDEWLPLPALSAGAQADGVTSR